MSTPPNTLNYTLPQANVYFTPTGGSKRHMGNCTSFTYTPTIDKLDHFSRMAPIRVKDRSVVRQVGANIAMTLEEIVEENWAIFMMASASTSTINGMTDTVQEGVIEFDGTNDIGTKIHWTGKVNFIPAGDLQFLAEDWQAIQLSAEVLISNGAYGQTTMTPEATA